MPQARTDLVRTGVVINGLPILTEPDESPGYIDLINLDEYYRDCVIGGPGAFYIPVSSMENFAKAIRMKLILEIAAAPYSAMPGMLRRVGYRATAASPSGRRTRCERAED